MNILRWILLGLVITMQFFFVETKLFAENNEYEILRNVASDNNEFAINIFNKLNTGDENLFFSPYSISTALSMTYAGAKGDTEVQMARVLNYKLCQKDLHKAFSILEKKLIQANADGNKMQIANAIWKEGSFIFLPSFLDIIKVNYGSAIYDVDFRNKFSQVRLEINKWVESKTNDKIKDLIPEGVLNSLTRIVLTNAIYFNGKWAKQFKVSMTKNDRFWLTKNDFITVPLMSLKDDLNYWSGKGLQIVELPYAGHKLSMLIIVPDSVNTNNDIHYDLFQAWDKENQLHRVQLYMPKFKLESSFSLKNILSEMGMPDAFSKKSDFSGMNGKKDLYISAILHKAFVDVTEEGTEAAAATAVVVGVRSMVSPEPKPITIRVDHPFVFVIRHNESGSILFMGNVNNPL